MARRTTRGSGWALRRSARSDRRHEASDRSTSAPTATRPSATPSTSDPTRCTSPSPPPPACSASCTSCRRPRLDVDARGRRPAARSATPARTGAADPCHLAFDESGDWSSPRTTPAAGSRRTRWLRMPRPTPSTPCRSPAPGRTRAPGVAARPPGRRRLRARPAARGRPRHRPHPRDRTRRPPESLAHDDAADIVVHAGAGPRHLVIAGDLAIMANELDRTASILDLEGDGSSAWFDVDDDVEPRGLGLSAIRLTRAGMRAHRRPRRRRPRRACGSTPPRARSNASPRCRRAGGIRATCT